MAPENTLTCRSSERSLYEALPVYDAAFSLEVELPKIAPTSSRSNRLREPHPVQGLVVVPNLHCVTRFRRELHMRAEGLAEKSHSPIVVGTPIEVLMRMRTGSLGLSNVQVIVIDACSNEELARPRAIGDLLKLVRPLPRACSCVLVVRKSGDGAMNTRVKSLVQALRSRTSDDDPNSGPAAPCRVIHVTSCHSTRVICGIFDCPSYYDSAKLCRR